MGLMSTALATTIGGVTSLVPYAGAAPVCAPMIALPSEAMPSVKITITQIEFSEIVAPIWHDVAWDALASSVKPLYAL